MKAILENLIKRESFLSYDLKTGGKIIGYIHLIAFVLNILRLFYVLYEWALSIWVEVTVSVILLIVTIGWLYGLQQENLTYMIPDLILSIICVCCLVIAFIYLPIREYYYVQEKFPKAPVTSEETYAEQDEVRNFFFAWWIIGFLCVIEWYFTTVKFCLFKSMKDGSNTTNQQNTPAPATPATPANTV